MSKYDSQLEMRRMLRKGDFKALLVNGANLLYDQVFYADIEDLTTDEFESERGRAEAVEFLRILKDTRQAVQDAIKCAITGYLSDEESLAHVKNVLEESAKNSAKKSVHSVNDERFSHYYQELSEDVFWDLVNHYAIPISRTGEGQNEAPAVVSYSILAGGKFFWTDMRSGDMGYLGIELANGETYSILWNSVIGHAHFTMHTVLGPAVVTSKYIQFSHSPFSTFYGLPKQGWESEAALRDMAEFLEKKREERDTEVDIGYEIEDNEYTKLPNDASPSAISALRWLEKNNTDVIPAKVFKKLPFGRKAWGIALLQFVKGRDITKQDIVARANLPASDSPVHNLLSEANVRFLKWGSDLQILWPGLDNFIYLVSTPFSKIAAYVDENTEVLEKRYLDSGYDYHPAYTGEMTLGWIRFTEVGPGVLWIDEIQTDAADMDHLGVYFDDVDWDDMLREILRRFILEMRRRGVQTIYIPEYRTASFAYERESPPRFPYSDLPLELGFQKVSELNEEEDFKLAMRQLRKKSGDAVAVVRNFAQEAFRINPSKRRKK